MRGFVSGAAAGYTSAMNARIVSSALSLIALSLALTGCGNKGPLVLPARPVTPPPPATPAGEVPVEISPSSLPPYAEPRTSATLPTPPALPSSEKATEPATDPSAATPATEPTPPDSAPATDEAAKPQSDSDASGQDATAPKAKPQSKSKKDAPPSGTSSGG